MRKFIRSVVWAFVVCVVLPIAAWSDTIIESVTFLDDDGYSFTEFTSIRTAFSNLFKPVEDTDDSAEAALSEHLYFFPNNYGFDTQAYDFNALTTQGPDRSEMIVGNLKDHVGIYLTTPEGNIVYKTWDEQTTRSVNGQTYFGRFWTGGIDKLANVWVLPSSMEFVNYTANVEGDWVLRGNALAFFATDTNNVTFEFEMRRKLDSTFRDLTENLANEQVDIRQDEDGITLTVLGTILFDSGSAEVSPSGMSVLGNIVSIIGDSGDFRVSVEGHTDNTQISGALAQTFPTNWELSSARSISVLKSLSNAGFDEALLEARAFGEHQPVASNDSAEGRAQNRRIEIRLVDK